LNNCAQQATHYEEKYQAILNLTNDIRTGIEKIVDVLRTAKLPSMSPKRPSTSSSDLHHSPESQIDETPSDIKSFEFLLPNDSLLGSNGVTDTNIVPYLGLIEHKTNDLLTLHFLINVPKRGAVPTTAEDKEGKDIGVPTAGIMVAGLLGQGPTPQLGSINIVPPSTGFV
ncbi:hypothetical protein HK096_000706, partial [Nowakowskiella sp. JEL0078]